MQSTALTPLGALPDDERCSLREAQHLPSLPAAWVAVPDPLARSVGRRARPACPQRGSPCPTRLPAAWVAVPDPLARSVGRRARPACPQRGSPCPTRAVGLWPPADVLQVRRGDAI